MPGDLPPELRRNPSMAGPGGHMPFMHPLAAPGHIPGQPLNLAAPGKVIPLPGGDDGKGGNPMNKFQVPTTGAAVGGKPEGGYVFPLFFLFESPEPQLSPSFSRALETRISPMVRFCDFSLVSDALIQFSFFRQVSPRPLDAAMLTQGCGHPLAIRACHSAPWDLWEGQWDQWGQWVQWGQWDRWYRWYRWGHP